MTDRTYYQLIRDVQHPSQGTLKEGDVYAGYEEGDAVRLYGATGSFTVNPIHVVRFHNPSLLGARDPKTGAWEERGGQAIHYNVGDRVVRKTPSRPLGEHGKVIAVSRRIPNGDDIYTVRFDDERLDTFEYHQLAPLPAEREPFHVDKSFELNMTSFSADKIKDILTPPEPQPAADDRPAIYVSGPMTGIPDFNYPAFHRAERVLTAMGYRVINPARMDEEMGTEGLTWHDFLARDLHAILDGDGVEGVAFIDGWRNSRGATLEGYVAQQAGKKVWELKIGPLSEAGKNGYSAPVRYEDENGNNVVGSARLDEIENVSVAYAAQSIVLGARRFAYGHPLDNFLKIAELWNATIGHKLSEKLDVRDVAMLMLQVKVAREYNSPKEDNRVDMVGYSLAYDESLKEAERRGGSLDDFLSDNALLLKQHSAIGADKNRKEG